MKPDHPEVGRELKASELQVGSIVVLVKTGRPGFTVWVREVAEHYVHFTAGEIRTEFLAKRVGDRVTDDANSELTMYQFLGKP
jgi:hypothetical protein